LKADDRLVVRSEANDSNDARVLCAPHDGQLAEVLVEGHHGIRAPPQTHVSSKTFTYRS
jgi:hypothetical protein